MTHYAYAALTAGLHSGAYQAITQMLDDLIGADDQAPNTMLETLQKERNRASHLAKLYSAASEHYRHLQAESRWQEVAE